MWYLAQITTYPLRKIQPSTKWTGYERLHSSHYHLQSFGRHGLRKENKWKSDVNIGPDYKEGDRIAPRKMNEVALSLCAQYVALISQLALILLNTITDKQLLQTLSNKMANLIRSRVEGCTFACITFVLSDAREIYTNKLIFWMNLVHTRSITSLNHLLRKN